MDAVKRGDRKAVAALARAAAVNATEADGTTALHWAVRNGDAETARLLLERGANASARNRYGVTPLSLAATNGDVALVRRLLVAGADPNTTVTEGQTVLMLAARTGRPEAIEALVEAGADVNAKEAWMGETALMWAAADNHADAVKTLVKHGAQIDARSTTVAYPQQKPKDPSNYVTSFVPKGQWTPLMYAAREGAADAAMALLALGADVNVYDPEGVTPLLEAILNAHFDLAAALLERGANPNLADKAGMAPLYAAIDMNTPPWERSRPDAKITTELDCVGLMRVLLDHGADVNARIKGRLLSRYHAGGAPGMIEGTTPLIRASKYANRDMVELLVSRGADVSLAQTDGTTALMFASGVRYLITQQGDPPNHGSLDDAYGIVKLLHEKGADLNAVNNRGETALYGPRCRPQQGHSLSGRARWAVGRSHQAGADGTRRGAEHGRRRRRYRHSCRRQARAGNSGPGTGADGGGRSSADDVERRRGQGRAGTCAGDAKAPEQVAGASPVLGPWFLVLGPEREAPWRALRPQLRRPVHQHGDRLLRVASRIDQEALPVG